MRKYSIILPVKNGGAYLKECVHSILSQDYRDFNLIVLENGSTDDTLDYLHSIHDPKVNVLSSSLPLTIDENWARITTVPKNDYITIIGHDDVLDKSYLSVMNRLVDQHPSASLYQAHFRYIDSQGKKIRPCMPMKHVLQPKEIVKDFLEGKMDIMGTGFMTRSADYDRVGGIKPYPNLLFADMELWIELGRKSYLAVAQEECFSYRQHPAATTSTSTDSKVLQAFDQFVGYLEQLSKNDPQLKETISASSLVLLQQYCQGISHKILRTPKSQRKTPSVAEVISLFRQYGRQLRGDDAFEPLQSQKVKMGKVIDSNEVLHTLFLLFKKVYRKPVY